MGVTRRKFSWEFKLEAVRQLEAGRRLAEVARELGVGRLDAQQNRKSVRLRGELLEGLTSKQL